MRVGGKSANARRCAVDEARPGEQVPHRERCARCWPGALPEELPEAQQPLRHLSAQLVACTLLLLSAVHTWVRCKLGGTLIIALTEQQVTNRRTLHSWALKYCPFIVC